jgi:cytochrome c biogenesis factor
MERITKQLTFGSLAALLAILAAATVVEKVFGSDAVRQYVYGAWWFAALWALFGAAGCAYLFRRKFYRRPAVFLLHCALGLILVGAAVTFTSAERGHLHLRQGETVSRYVSEDGETERPLPFEVKLVLFDIEYHPGTAEPADYISFLKIGDDIRRVSMNRIARQNNYRLYQMDYDPDEMGSVLLVARDPWGIGVTYAGYLLVALSMVWVRFTRIGWRGVLFTLLPTAAVWFYISRINPMTPVLRTPMLAAHVSVIMVSYALLLTMAVTGGVGLCSAARRGRMHRWNSKLLFPAVFLLAAGIFIGAVWANISWGRYWGWDAKEVWALVTLLLYAVPMHRESIPAFREPKKFLLFCTVAFLAVAMTFFGVTYLLGGIHSYV